MTDMSKILEGLAKELYLRALKEMPPDIKRGIRKAHERENEPRARSILGVILENIDVAEKEDLFVCQDTGLPIFFIGVGERFHSSMREVETALTYGVKNITLEYPIRSNTLDTLTRKRTHTNTGRYIPVFHYYPLEGEDVLRIKFVPKGSGSENMSFLKMLKPADGYKAVKKFVLECVSESGANPCPPVVVGVGVGGTSDLCMKLAKTAATRNIEKSNPDPEAAKLEKELFKEVNELGIGPMGLGGDTTAIAVNVEKADTHISHNPVAVNMQCWAARRSGAVVGNNGEVSFFT